MNDNNPFINQTDPTSLLDLSNVEISNQYSKLTEREKLLVLCKINGITIIRATRKKLYDYE